MSTHHSVRLARPAASSGEMSPGEEREMGLATYTRDSENIPIARSFLFQNNIVQSFSDGTRANGERGEDDQSIHTLFEDTDQQERSKHTCHSYKDTEIDKKSTVYNGSIVGAETSETVRKHHLNGGSVKNESKLVNGDLDRETFLAFFCNTFSERPSTPPK